MKYISKNLEDTKNIAKEIIQIIDNQKKDTSIIFFKGDLGSGKTALVKEMAKILQIDQDITSPTYIVMKEYDISQSNSLGLYKRFIHIDAYRLNNFDELTRIGYRKRFGIKGDLVCIEWPELINEKENLKADITVNCDYGENEKYRLYEITL